ncbi:MAG: Alkaline phosphatase PafA precursor [Verrucomicrobiota bacterium]|jgi:predicted AlkP superfamily pyrophosphatase or phosphodiesterase
MTLRFLLLGGLLALPAGAAEPAPRPGLAVVIAIDQFRSDYLTRFRPYFGQGGFKRLLEGGAEYQNCHYRHAVTITAPGHATILSGVHANVHGITANEWLDRDSWMMMNSVEDRAAPLVGVDAGKAGPALLAEKSGRSPRNFHATTVGDQLKLRHGANSKVFAASNKDRSAILLGGALADGAYWDENGRFVTSRYYRPALPAWIEAFNAERRADAKFGATWDRLRDAAIYDAVQGPDDAPGETADFGFTRTLPKKVTGGADKITPKFYTAFDNSPFSAVFLGEFVERAIREEKLGHHAATDLLCVSFSQIDVMGHSYGPDSHEMMDSVLRLDRVIASLLDCLDREVGLANCLIVLTADHGGAPMPERVQALNPGIPAGRVNNADVDAAARKALDSAFGGLAAGELWFTRDNAGFHLRPTALAAKNVRAEDAARVLKESVLALPYIAAAFTRAEILAAPPEGESLAAMMRRSYFPPRDRDVVYVTKPYFFVKPASGTSHGSPYAYDTNVPQLWYGAGIAPGIHRERVGVDDIAPTLASLLGVPEPPQAQGRRLY